MGCLSLFARGGTPPMSRVACLWCSQHGELSQSQLPTASDAAVVPSCWPAEVAFPTHSRSSPLYLSILRVVQLTATLPSLLVSVVTVLLHLVH